MVPALRQSRKSLPLHTLFCAGLALPCLLLLLPSHARAQVAFGSMVGNVTDSTGGAVPGANVKITLTTTNDTRSIQTNAAGEYTISTVTPGTYRVEISRDGFTTFVATDILVNMNNVVRVNAQLQVGAIAQKVEVTTTAAAQLETDRADVHAEIATTALLDLPQPNRTYEGLLELVPGTAPPAGQLSGGTNNPSKSMTFAFNGTGTAGGTVRIEGINALNLWNTSAQSYVPSIEAIQNVNVATNANDSEQGIAGGASVNVMLKSGSNDTHGALYEYNTDSAFEANNFFSNASGISKPPLLVDNDTGAFIGGHIIRNKLFYFSSFEGDINHSANSGVLSPPQCHAALRQHDRLEQPHLRSQHGQCGRDGQDAVPGQPDSREPDQPGDAEDHSQYSGHQRRRAECGYQQLLHQRRQHLQPVQIRYQGRLCRQLQVPPVGTVRLCSRISITSSRFTATFWAAAPRSRRPARATICSTAPRWRRAPPGAT